MLLGYVLTRVFKLPAWVTPAISFNNTTALPLLLISSLQQTGVLDSLLMSETDTSAAALLRAKSYILVNAMIGDSLTFALGPKLLDGEEAPDKDSDASNNSKPSNHDINDQTSNGHHSHHESTSDPERGSESQHTQPQESEPDEQTSLLPNAIVHSEQLASRNISASSSKGWGHLPNALQRFLTFSYAFLHPPLLGAVTGAITGLAPPLHRAFFDPPLEGGIFTAWLTDSVHKIGELFPALQVVVVGVKLSTSLRKMKRGEDSGSVPWPCLIVISTIRFILWPAISISVIYVLRVGRGCWRGIPCCGSR